MKRRRRGTGTIESSKASDGTLRYRARLPGSDKKREPIGVYESYKAADDALLVARKKETDKAALKLTGITVSQYGPGFLDQREHDKVRGVKTERNRWKNLVDESPLGALPMKAVQRADAKSWVRWLGARRIKYAHKHPRNGKHLSRTTKQNILNLVRKAFDDAREDGTILVNPFAGLKLKKETRTHDPWTYLLPEEQTALLNSLHSKPRRWALVAFAMFSGMRQAEVYSLRWEDVKALTIVVRYSASGEATKGGRPRVIPILGLGQDALEIQRGKRQEPRGLVFPNQQGTRRFKGEPSWWKRALEDAGLSDGSKRHDGQTVRFHDLRHTAGTSLTNGWWGERWDLRDVQAFLGHASIVTTERYSHAVEANLLRAAERTKYTPTFAEGDKRLGTGLDRLVEEER